MSFGKYSKFIVALVGFVVVLLTQYFGDANWLPPLVSLLTALGVYQVPNREV